MVQQTSLPLSTMLQGIPSSQHMHTIFAAFSQLNFATVVVAVLHTMQNVAQYQCIFLHCIESHLCLQCFDAVGWAAGRASGL